LQKATKIVHQKIYLACVGDANDYKAWSGIPFFMLSEAKAQGVINEGLRLHPQKIGIRFVKFIWNFSCLIIHGKKGGFQFTNIFMSMLWNSSIKKIKYSKVINCFQLYPLEIIKDHTIEKYFFIDQTLTQLYENYLNNGEVGKRVMASSLQTERMGYASARLIFAHSQWCKNSLIKDYGCAEEKVIVVQPGASFFEKDILEIKNAREIKYINQEKNDDPLRLIFVGKEPKRKGLNRLLSAVKLAHSWGARIELSIVGCNANDLGIDEDLARMGLEITWHGMLDKVRDKQLYLSLLTEADIGCLFSLAEAGGICLREFHAVGMAVIAPNVGGSPDHADKESAKFIKPDDSVEYIAKIIFNLHYDRNILSIMHQSSLANSEKMLWKYSIKKMALYF